MSFEGFNDKDEPISDINMTPLIDVMLVLLVIFIITAPLLTKAINIDLPTEKAKPIESVNKNISISINVQGDFFWNQDKISENDLLNKFKQQFDIDKDSSIELRADNKTNYQFLAKVMALAQQAGLYKLNFVMQDKI